MVYDVDGWFGGCIDGVRAMVVACLHEQMRMFLSTTCEARTALRQQKEWGGEKNQYITPTSFSYGPLFKPINQ